MVHGFPALPVGWSSTKVLAMCIAGSLIAGAGCGDDSTQPPPPVEIPCFIGFLGEDVTAFYDSDGPIRAVDATLNSTDLRTLLVIADQAALHTFDVSPGGILTRQGSLEIGRNANAVNISDDGNTVFVASRGMGFQVVSIADRFNPTLLPTPPDPAAVFDVDRVDDVVYVAALETGLIAFDVSDPENPVRTLEVDTPGTAREVAVAGEYVIVADEEGGIHVIDPSLDPPAIVKTVATPTGELATDVHAVNPATVLVSARNDGLLVLDVSGATSTVVGRFEVPGIPAGISSTGDLAYVAAVSGDVVSVDISDRTHPRRVGWAGIEGDAFSMHTTGLFVYATGSDGLSVIHPDDDMVTASIGRTVDIEREVNDVLVANPGRLFAASESGITSVNLTWPPTIESTYSIETCRRLALRDNFLYSASVKGMDVFQISFDESFVVPIAFLATPGSAVDIAFADTLAFVADAGAGVQIFDIRSPADPFLRFTVNTEGSALGVAYTPGYVCVADGAAGISIIDIRSVPAIVGELPIAGFIRDVAVRWPYLYAARTGAGSSGVVVIDISAPGTPTIVNEVVFLAPTRLEGVRHYLMAYVGDEGMVVLNLSTPSAPVIEGRTQTLRKMVGGSFSEANLFVFDDTGIIQEWDSACTVPLE